MDELIKQHTAHCKRVRPARAGNKEWGIIKAPEGGIMGVYSLSNEIPQKTGNFSQQYEEFASSQKYSDWQFIYRPNVVANKQLAKP